MTEEQKCILYDYENSKLVELRQEYIINDKVPLPPPPYQVYLCRLSADGNLEVYRVLGRKSGKPVVTSRYTEAVDDAFIEKLQQDAKGTPFGVYFGVEEDEPADEAESNEFVFEVESPVATPEQPRPTENEYFTFEPATDAAPVVSSADSALITQPALDNVPVQTGFTSSQLNDLPEVKKNIFSKVFGRKHLAGKIFYMGDANSVVLAQNRIRSILDRANINELPFDEVITPRRLVTQINQQKNVLVLVNVAELRSTSEGLDAYRILTSNGVQVVDIRHLCGEMRDTEILSLIQNIHTVDVKSVLYTDQRVFMFVSNTGGVGKTTLSFNFSHWLATKGVNVMYMELLSGKGIDKVVGKDTASLENIFDGREKPRAIEVDAQKHMVYCVSLESANSGSVDNKNNWIWFFNNFVYKIDETDPENKEIVRLRKDTAPFYHAVVIDTYSDSHPTRVLMPQFATDVVMVIDMRPTTTASQILDTIIGLSMNTDVTKKNFYLAYNQYRDNPDVKRHYEYTRAELESLAEERGIKLNAIRIPNNPDCMGQIHIKDDKHRMKVVAPLVEAFYGIKI